MSKTQKNTAGGYAFDLELDRAFIPLHRVEAFSSMYNVRFAEILKQARFHHAMSPCFDVSDAYIANN